MSTIRVVLQSSLAPERVLQAAYDFSDQRAEIWPAVSVPRLTVHDRGDTWADVTEGTRAGPVVNWERCRYDWSQPGSVTAPVTDSNVYAFPASGWEIKATGTENGSQVEMIWAREFKPGPRGIVFGALFRIVGNRLFSRYAREVLTNLERLERNEQPNEPHAAYDSRGELCPSKLPIRSVRRAAHSDLLMLDQFVAEPAGSGDPYPLSSPPPR